MSSTPCFLHTENQSVCHGIVKLCEVLISHTFQRKRYTSIVRTENVIMYALGPVYGNDPIL